MHEIAVIPGDGIGGEVVAEARRVLDRTGELWSFEFGWREFDWSCERYAEMGRMMPEDGLDRLAEHEAIFLGAVGQPGVPDHVSLWGLLIPIRRTFRQYVNLRPVKLFEGLEGPLRNARTEDVDLVVVRENNEGEYSEVGGRVYHGTPEETAVQEAIFTRRGVGRVVRYAFARAKERWGILASATKSNGIVHTMPFWDEIFDEVSRDYPDVQTSQYHIDALVARFVLDPASLDVVVASNLFGDILSDLGAAVAGSIGIAPSANLNPENEYPSMFEPVHGSALDIAGKGMANPVGQIWSGAMMLDHLGHEEAAAAILSAIEEVFAKTEARPPRPRRHGYDHRDDRRDTRRPRRARPGTCALDFLQRLFQVKDYVFGVFYAAGEAYQVLFYPQFLTPRRREFPVRRGRRMYRQGVHVAEARGFDAELQGVEETEGVFATIGFAGCQLEGDEAAGVGEDVVGHVAVRVVLEGRMVDLLDLRVGVEPGGDLPGVHTLAAHPQRQRLESSQGEPGFKGTEHPADELPHLLHRHIVWRLRDRPLRPSGPRARRGTWWRCEPRRLRLAPEDAGRTACRRCCLLSGLSLRNG